MKRSGFKRPQFERPPAAPLVPLARLPNDGPSARAEPVQKDGERRSEAYRRWVAELQCAHCGRAGPSQCAHSDEGKGLALKAGDDTCFPLCADGPGRRGCHSILGASGAFARDHRRYLERTYAARTVSAAIADGKFPEEWL